MDNQHNGRYWPAGTNSGQGIDLQDKQWHTLKARTHFMSEWCGVPWRADGNHFKAFGDLRHNDDPLNIRISQSYVENGNYILWQRDDTGEIFMRQQVPADGDYECQLRFQVDGQTAFVIPYLDVTGNGGVIHNIVFWRNEVGEWVEFGAGLIGTLIKKVFSGN